MVVKRVFLTTFLRFRILINIIQENPSREIPFRSNQLCYRLISNGCWKKTLIRINLRISSKIFRFLSKILMEYLILLRCTECIHLCRLKCIKCVSTGEGHYSYGVCVLLEHEINTHCINYCWRSKSVYAHLWNNIVSMLGIIQVLSVSNQNISIQQLFSSIIMQYVAIVHGKCNLLKHSNKSWE